MAQPQVDGFFFLEFVAALERGRDFKRVSHRNNDTRLDRQVFEHAQPIRQQSADARVLQYEQVGIREIPFEQFGRFAFEVQRGLLIAVIDRDRKYIIPARVMAAEQRIVQGGNVIGLPEALGIDLRMRRHQVSRQGGPKDIE